MECLYIDKNKFPWSFFKLIACLLLITAGCGSDNPQSIIGYDLTYTRAALLNISPPLSSNLSLNDTIKASLHIELKDTFGFENFNEILVNMEFLPDPLDLNGFYTPISKYSVSLEVKKDTLNIICPIRDLLDEDIQTKPLVFRFGMAAYYDCDGICFHINVLTGDYQYSSVVLE